MNPSRELRQAKRLAVIEAALYTAGRPVTMAGLQRLVRTRSEKVVHDLVRKLARRYEARGSALEIKELPGNRVILQLKSEFTKMVKRFNKKPLLSRGPLKTLSYVAYNQPVDQTKVIEDRGSHVYSHLRLMEEMGLITREKAEGRWFIIKTTPYFSDYFGFSHDPLKSRLQLRQMFNMMKITKLDNGNGGSERLMTMPQPPPKVLADARGGLPDGLMEYPSPAHRGSQ